MIKATKYRYEKRIKDLQDRLTKAENDRYEYKQLTIEIFNVLTEMVQNGKQINQGWLLSKFRRIFR